jgi:hypothetical protein
VCHMTFLPGQSQENLPNLSLAHLYGAGGTGFSHLSLSKLSIGVAAGWHIQSEWKRCVTLMTIKLARYGNMLLVFPNILKHIQGFVIEIYTLW